MYQYEMSPYSNINPQSYSSINPQSSSNPFQSVSSQGIGYGQNYPQNIQQRYGFSQNVSPFPTTPFAGAQAAFPFQGSQTSPYQSAFQNPSAFQQEFAGQQNSYLSPEHFAGILGGQSQQRGLGSGLVDPIFITELSRSARGLQDAAEQLEGVWPTTGQGQPRDPEAHRKALYAATAHLFYAFGLLASKGIFIPGELPGKTRLEVGGPANACREFGKELERFVDKAASGRGVIEHLSTLVERGKVCYTEITKTLEVSETTDQQTRKKAVA